MRIGILALQGDYAKHAERLNQLAVANVLVRKPQELAAVDGLIIPGGESTTALKFLADNDFFSALEVFGKTKPIFGTCAGAILLANEVHSPKQKSLALIDIAIERNAYGRQVQSHIDQGVYAVDGSAIELVFIRAPKIIRVGKDVEVIVNCHGEPVAVHARNILAATFHPELSADTRLHHYFCEMVKKNKSKL